MSVTTPAASTTHPLAQLSAAELSIARDVLVEAGLVVDSTRFVYVGLEEPDKAGLYREGEGGRPTAGCGCCCTTWRARTLATSSSRSTQRHDRLRPRAGRRDRRAAAGARRGVRRRRGGPGRPTSAGWPRWPHAGLDVGQVRVAPLSAGVFEYPEEEGRRILRGLAFVQDHPADHAWAHPIDGLVAYVDVIDQDGRPGHRRLGAVPVPAGVGQLRRPGRHAARMRTTQKPIEITQPEGPSFTLDGNRARAGRTGSCGSASTPARA